MSDIVASQLSSATESLLCSQQCGWEVGLEEDGGFASNNFSQKT